MDIAAMRREYRAAAAFLTPWERVLVDEGKNR